MPAERALRRRSGDTVFCRLLRRRGIAALSSTQAPYRLFCPLGQKSAHSAVSPLKNTNTPFGLCFCFCLLRTYMVADMAVKLRRSLSSPVKSVLCGFVHVVIRRTKCGGLQRGVSPLAMFSLGVPVSLTYIKETGTKSPLGGGKSPMHGAKKEIALATVAPCATKYPAPWAAAKSSF